MERLVYVVTDAPRRDRIKARLGGVLTSTALVGMVAVPLWALAAVPVSILLGWHWLATVVVGIAGLPALITLTDLLAARLGLPSLAWAASQALGRGRQELTAKENRTHV